MAWDIVSDPCGEIRDLPEGEPGIAVRGQQMWESWSFLPKSSCGPHICLKLGKSSANGRAITHPHFLWWKQKS